MKKTIVLALATLALAVPAAAHGDHDHRDRDDRRGPDHRDTVVVVEGFDLVAAVEQDIRRGMQRGDITHREAERLRAEVREYEHIRRRVLRDGRLSRGEEKQLLRAEDRLVSRVQRELRDEDRRHRFDHDNARDRARDHGRGDHHRDGYGQYRPVVAVADPHHSGC